MSLCAYASSACVCLHVQTSETSFASIDVAFKIRDVGVSLICDTLGEELCFAGLSQLALGLQQRGEKQKTVIRIEGIQIDNQMEGGKKPVVLANRGGKIQEAVDLNAPVR